MREKGRRNKQKINDRRRSKKKNKGTLIRQEKGGNTTDFEKRK